MDQNPRTEIGLLCGRTVTVRQRIQTVHNSFKEAAGRSEWTTASFLADDEPGNTRKIEIPPAAVSYFRIVGETEDHV